MTHATATKMRRPLVFLLVEPYVVVASSLLLSFSRSRPGNLTFTDRPRVSLPTRASLPTPRVFADTAGLFRAARVSKRS